MKFSRYNAVPTFLFLPNHAMTMVRLQCLLKCIQGEYMFQRRKNRPVLCVYYDGDSMYCLWLLFSNRCTVQAATIVPAHDWAQTLMAIKKRPQEVRLAIPSHRIIQKQFMTHLHSDADIESYIQLHQAALLTELDERILFDFSVQTDADNQRTVSVSACCRQALQGLLQPLEQQAFCVSTLMIAEQCLQSFQERLPIYPQWYTVCKQDLCFKQAEFQIGMGLLVSGGGHAFP
jgi:hypothetical protein